MSNISRGIVCCHYFRIMMTSAIAGFQIQMVPSQWYTNNQKDKDVAAETCCFINQEAAQNFLGVILTPNPLTVPTTVTIVLCCAAKKKSNMEKYEDLRDKQLNLLLSMTAIMK